MRHNTLFFMAMAGVVLACGEEKFTASVCDTGGQAGNMIGGGAGSNTGGTEDTEAGTSGNIGGNSGTGGNAGGGIGNDEPGGMNGTGSMNAGGEGGTGNTDEYDCVRCTNCTNGSKAIIFCPEAPQGCNCKPYKLQDEVTVGGKFCVNCTDYLGCEPKIVPEGTACELTQAYGDTVFGGCHIECGENAPPPCSPNSSCHLAACEPAGFPAGCTFFSGTQNF